MQFHKLKIFPNQ